MPGSTPVVLIAEELAPSVLEVLGDDVEIRHVDGADRAALLPALRRQLDRVPVGGQARRTAVPPGGWTPTVHPVGSAGTDAPGTAPPPYAVEP